MRYHFDKPEIYLSLYGERYICEHPVYNSCTLYRIEERGLAVIQQRFDSETKSTWWSEVDPWITDALYLHPGFREYFFRKNDGKPYSIDGISKRKKRISLYEKPLNFEGRHGL